MTKKEIFRLPHLSQSRIPGLDLLRSLAIIFVFLHHLPLAEDSFFSKDILLPINSVLWSGVDLFFVLSGFLIASQWFSSLEKDSLGWAIKKFYIKRSFRILPPYWIALAIYTAQAQFLTHHDYNIFHYLIFVQNFFSLPIFGVSWSLCVEEHFYIFFPAIAFALWGLNKKWLAVIAGISAILLSLYFRNLYWHSHVKELYQSFPSTEHTYANFKIFYHSIYFPTYCRLDGLTCGVTLAATRHYLPKLWTKLQKKAHLIALLGIALGIATHILVFDKYQWVSTVFGFLFLAISYSCLVFSASDSGNWLGKLNVSGTNTISHLSYAMYLVFPAVFTLSAVVSKKIPFLKTQPLLFIFQALLLFLASQAVYQFIEKPSLALRKKVLNKASTKQTT